MQYCQDKWYLILNLSNPKDTSVNGGIDYTLCSLTYVKMDSVVQQVCTFLGKECFLAKIDIENLMQNPLAHINCIEQPLL